ncbi:hypothetical protein EAF04_006117 [Stromatinia cepivora]|nr:hypothetical protein EAF04_006117 [Stromatinia cepivora]
MAFNGQEIAIIGSGCRFPGGANSPSKLWDLVHNPRQVAEPIPLDRFSAQGFYHENGQYHGHFNVKEAYFLEGEGTHRRFDASFFGMTPTEAVSLDPQCRLLLETVYEALEAAGLTIESLCGSDTAVYIGQMVADYDQIMMRDSDVGLGTYHGSGTSHAILSNRISYFFDWHGPSMTIDTACSSSLVSLHQAVQQLRTGNSRIAIAGGANLIMDPKCFIFLSSLNMLSPDGRSRMWDADAKGYARGEGIGAVVLKTLSSALEDGDDIECLIRETGTAQDGKTQGITSPNHAAQTQLIRDCYSRAGLDLKNPAHRPQFFECHGTGTLAGDAAEAEAISAAFFPGNKAGGFPSEQVERLFVGSIKSLIGHTEGTAGIAGILKASLALQNSAIPPNLLLNSLNPRIQPFVTNLQVPSRLAPWPTVMNDSPRRASVNSFGFGGANAHAILESYTPGKQTPSAETSVSEVVFTPFVFSAYSQKSLVKYLQKFKEYVQANATNVCLRDLAYTLHSRRTSFQVAMATDALTTDDLCAKIDAKLQGVQQDSDGHIVIRATRNKSSKHEIPCIIGVFTGQGAQWAGMSSHLLKTSTESQKVLKRLEARLSQLPLADRPSWSLTQELQRDPDSSRIDEAEYSQPLCTAIQILQVEILRSAGIEFTAVVGHSSGEIAAAYAAGFISAGDAICIAYYRGLHSKLASGDGRPGAMLAVGTSLEDAQELCDDDEFQGRACVAAVNSPVSVTISGDKDAVEEMKLVFEDEKKFARLLKVEKAYHSHHMSSSSAAYLKALAALELKTSQSGRSNWFSSVLDGKDMCGESTILRDKYWDSNMLQPVLFKQALENAYASKGPFDLAIEVGPHPALKSPVLQTVQEISSQELRYTGLFHRGTSSIQSVSAALGYIWAYFGEKAVNLHNYDRFISADSPCKLVKGLPTYAWDHDEYWNESRYAKAIRLRPGPVHELLGHMTPDSNGNDIRWRHALRPIEIPWLMGHRLQDQIVFPAAGYVVTALEAAMAMCRQKCVSVTLIKLADVEFGRALIFDTENSTVEIIVSMADITQSSPDTIEANFRYHAADWKNDGPLNLLATARVEISIGEPVLEALPARSQKPLNLTKIQVDDFYHFSKDLEYQWAGPFIALDKVERKLGAATGYMNIVERTNLLLHPALLDAAFQGVLLAYSFPDDGQLWTIHVPGKIRHISVNPFLCSREMAKGSPLPFASSHDPETEKMVGNTDVYTSDNNLENAMIQVEDLECVPLSRASAQDDKELFATVIWGVASPDAESITDNTRIAKEKRELAALLERLAHFYMRTIERSFPSDHPARMSGPYTQFLQFVNKAISSERTKDISLWQSEWENDTYESLILKAQPFADTIDMQLLRKVGDSVADIISGDKSEIEFDKGVTAWYFADALGPSIYNKSLSQMVKQISHRYPHSNILQLGSGVGAATKLILEEIGSAYSSYTFTDISPSFFEPVKSWVGSHIHKMIFKTLDISQDPFIQGFLEQSYDVVVASLVFHATPDPEQALRNARRLLKPGGQLIVLEIIPTRSSVYEFIFSASPGWWRSIELGELASPILDLMEWDTFLRKTGFSGCDTTTPLVQEQNCMTHFVVWGSQAMDDKMIYLRNPLSSASFELFKPGTLIPDLIIVGGAKLETARLVEHTKNLLHHHCGKIRVYRKLSELLLVDIRSETMVLSLVQLDGTLFQNIDHTQWESLKTMLMSTGALLWVTQGRRGDNPFGSMMVGLMRSIIREVLTLRYQMLDFEGARNPDAYTLAESLLRFTAEILWREQDKIHTSVETELVLNTKGRVLIPRLVMNDEMNARYNSLKRPIVARFDPHDQNIGVAPNDGASGFALIQGQILHDDMSGTTQINVTHSLISAIHVCEFGSLFIILGKDRLSGNWLISLTHNHTSIACPWKNLSVKLDVQTGYETKLFSLVVYHLLASVTLRGLSIDDTVLVYEPTLGFAATLASEARRIGVHVKFITTSSTADVDGKNLEWLRIHPSTPHRTLFRLLPKTIAVFFDFNSSTGSEITTKRIRSVLSPHCRYISLATMFATNPSLPPNSQISDIYSRLCEAVAFASGALLNANAMEIDSLPVISPESFAELTTRPTPYSLIDWTICSNVPAQIRPINTQITFSNCKTYWLAGLSRGLGLALCEWMIRHGAKYFVISSRAPKIDPNWLEDMHELGAVIKVTACDVTIRRDVLALHQDICATMPPIAGVTQGSMVLEDTPIRDTTLENLLRGTRPKVEGSIHLNDIFQENTLDFFIFFSSVVSTIGRPGQANYSAANMFMSGLAEQRRQKGLAASVIHIGAIYGVGYASQLDRMIYSRAAFRSTALIPTSERDFYQLFAEAVIAGRPNSAHKSIDLLNGTRRIGPDDQDRPVWESEPFMSHFIKNRDGLSSAVGDGQFRIPLKTQLALAHDRNQIYSIIQDAFLPKIYDLFQLDSGKISKESLAGLRLDEMGIDSLLAVEIRGWFMKTLEVNIPVLKILGGVPISGLIIIATETIPDRLIPGLEVDQDSVAIQDKILGSPSTKETVNGPGTASGSDAGNPNDSIKISPVVSSDIDESVDGSMPSSPVQKKLELSFSQDMFWFVWKFLTDKTSLNHTAWARITGKIRIEDFRKAVRSLAQQHEILRTCIIEEKGKPVQAIMENSQLHLESREIDEEQEMLEAVRFLQDDHVYNVAEGQTVRVMLLSLSPEEHFFVAGLHPLIADGMSFQSLLKGFSQLYSYPSLSKTLAIRQFAEYSEKQHSDFVAGKFENDLKFWKAEFATLPPPLPILTISKAFSRPTLTTYENVKADITIDSETKAKVQAVCRQYRTTPFHFYLTVFRTLLLRFAPVGDGEDIAIGIGDGNRTEDEMMDVIGPFVNLLPLRLRSHAAATFSYSMQDTRDKVLAALAHSQVPFQVLLNKLEVSRSASYTSLFQCFVNYRQGLLKSTRLGPGDDLEIHSVQIGISKMAYDVTLEMVDYADGECFQTLVVRKDLYGEAEATTLVECYKRLVKAFVTNPGSSLDGAELFGKLETQEAMKLSRGLSSPSKTLDTVVHIIDRMAREQPNTIAVRYGNESSTYGEISAHANGIAASLRVFSLPAGSPVAVLIDPSPSWISALLGLMRAGAVYLPLDMALTWNRLNSIVQDCRPSIVLVDKKSRQHASRLDSVEMQMIDVSQVEQTTQIVPIYAVSSNPAVILYTSGSSGTPKGIVLKHGGLRNWAEPLVQIYNFGAETVLQQTSPSFDLSLMQIFTALCLGGNLFIVPRQERGDAKAIAKAVASNGITFTCGTPTEYATWLQYGKQNFQDSPTWWKAFCAGESVPLSLVKQISSLDKADLTLWNLYGPTETSLACTGSQVHISSKCGPIAAGRPLPNYSVYVLDDQLRPVPTGVQGEIYIGGAGVGLGYIHKPEYTSTRFIANIFATPEDKENGWTTMHRTGDFGRWREDGEIIIEGRIDTQIKLRGLRIDLGEIGHNLLRAVDGVLKEAVVSLRMSSPGKPDFLVAHVAFAETADTKQYLNTIHSELRKTLPQYMCPSIIVPIDKMPTTSSGKLDRKLVATLPLSTENNDPANGQEEGCAVALTDTEARLKQVWEHILDSRVKITARSDFFHVGGSSLLLLGLQARILENFNTDMPLIRMFDSSTLGAMAYQIDRGGAQLHTQAIDWKVETSLSPALQNLTIRTTIGDESMLNSPPQVVVLTGATGNLGRALLEQLLADPNTKHIHCLGVRNVQRRFEFDMAAMIETNKVTLHEGDLVQPRMGLSEVTAAAVFSEASSVIHNAADMSYLKTYVSLRAANLQSTKDLVEMVARYGNRRRVPFHYVSTVSVGNTIVAALRDQSIDQEDIDEFVFGPISIAEYPPPSIVVSPARDISQIAHGYVATKWASEVFLEKLHKRHPDWPIVIHRPSLIIRKQTSSWEGQDAESPGLELVENLRRYSTQLRAIPAMPIIGENNTKLSGAFDIVSIDEVVRGVMGALQETGSDREDVQESLRKEVRILHHIGGVDLPLSDLRSWVVEHDQAVIEIDPFEWVRKAGELGMQPTMVALLQDLAASEGQLSFPRLTR